MCTHRPTAPDRLVGGAAWHLSACGALQECLGAEVARPARVEKDPQGRLYLAAEVCQLRTPSGPAVWRCRPTRMPRHLVIYTPTSDMLSRCTALSAELCRSVCGPPQWGAVYLQLTIPVSLHSTLRLRSELCSPHHRLKSPVVAHYNKTTSTTAVQPGPVLMAQGKRNLGGIFFALCSSSFFKKTANPTKGLLVVLGVHCRECAGQAAVSRWQKGAQGQVRSPETFSGSWRPERPELCTCRTPYQGPPRRHTLP